MKTIGITTTVPIEIILAAGYQPSDLNNVFINDPDPERLVTVAERAGFPLNCCSWIKGIYGVCTEYGIDTVLCVTNGDCSNTIMLMEVLKLKGIKVIPFAYPDEPDARRMHASLQNLAETDPDESKQPTDPKGTIQRIRAEAQSILKGKSPRNERCRIVSDAVISIEARDSYPGITIHTMDSDFENLKKILRTQVRFFKIDQGDLNLFSNLPNR